MEPIERVSLSRARDALNVALGQNDQEKGFLSGRFLKTLALVGRAAADQYISEKRWAGGATLKNAVQAIEVSDVGAGSALADVHADFLDIARPLSVLGRLPGLAPSQFGLTTICRSGANGAVFHSENTAAPVADFRFAYLPPLKPRTVSGFAIVTRESLDCRPGLDRFIAAALAADIAETIDRHFLDPATDGSGAAPASPLHGAATVASAGSDAAALRYDLETLVAIFEGDLTRGVLITDPVTAVQIGLAQQPFGGANLNLAGTGNIFGLPIIVSNASPRDSTGGQIALIDVGALRYSLEVAALDASQNALITMDTDPGANPPSETRVSCFQQNSFALRARCAVDWEIRPDSAALVIGCNYSQGVSP